MILYSIIIESVIPGAVEKLIVMDASYEMVQVCKNAADLSNNDNVESVFVVGDEEFLPIKERCIWSHLYYYLIIILHLIFNYNFTLDIDLILYFPFESLYIWLQALWIWLLVAWDYIGLMIYQEQ